MCYKMFETRFTDVTEIESWELFYFIEVQMGKLEDVAAQLVECRNVTKEIISNACNGALLGRGFIVDETIELEKEKTKLKKDKRLKTSYIEQSEKKNFCIRLKCFITLADYLTLDMTHGIIAHSGKELLEMIETHMKFIPTLEMVESAELNKPIAMQREEGDPKVLYYEILKVNK